MATNGEKLAAIRKDAAQELLHILTGDDGDGALPHDIERIAQYVAIVRAADNAMDALENLEEPLPSPPDHVGRNDFEPLPPASDPATE